MEQVALIRENTELAQEQARLSAKHGEQNCRLQSTSARKVFRDLFGRTKADMQTKQDLSKALEQIERQKVAR